MKNYKCLKYISLISVLTINFSLNAQSVSTDPVGYVSNDVQVEGEAVLSPVLHRSSVFTGVVSAISDSDSIVVDGTPSWSTTSCE